MGLTIHALFTAALFRSFLTTLKILVFLEHIHTYWWHTCILNLSNICGPTGIYVKKLIRFLTISTLKHLQPHVLTNSVEIWHNLCNRLTHQH